MRSFFWILLSFAPLLASAAASPDPRNTPHYHIIFDIEAHGDTPLVDGYGAYIQVYENAGTQIVRYCENFEGHNAGGHPNPDRSRTKLVPVGTVNNSAYRCRDYSLADLAIGQPLITMGKRSFFAMKSATWTVKDGGEILFEFAKRIPLFGSPTYKTLRVRASRKNAALDYTVESVIPRGAVDPAHFLLFDVSGSGLGIQNGINGLTLDPTERTERKVDLGNLEGPFEVRGTGKNSAGIR